MVFAGFERVGDKLLEEGQLGAQHVHDILQGQGQNLKVQFESVLWAAGQVGYLDGFVQYPGDQYYGQGDQGGVGEVLV